MIGVIEITEPKGICKEGISTGTEPVKKMNRALRKRCFHRISHKKIKFKFGSELKKSFVMPGMSVTNVNGALCGDMVPQGITYHDGYYFITAYCGKSEHNSVIYVVEGSSQSLVATFVITGKPHAGGITYAGGFLWVCATYGVYYYKYSEIRYAIECAKDNIKSIDLNDYTRGYIALKGHGRASFITTYKEYLCVGEYVKDKKANGVLKFYYPSSLVEGKVESVASCQIPPRAQGVDFYETDNCTYMAVTSSYGILNSVIYVYECSDIIKNPPIHTKTIKFPCMLEEVVTHDGYTSFVFESCGRKYRYPLIPIIGNVCEFKADYIYK